MLMKRTKQQPKRRTRKRAFHRRLAWMMTATAVFIVSCLLIYTMLNTGDQKNVDGTAIMKAAIVDQLSDSSPNQTFVETSKSLLKNASFNTYYYSKAAIDVNFFRNLPSRGFRLIILRVHSAINEQSDLLVFFTAEPFSDSAAGTTYLSDFLCNPPRLVRARMYEGAEPFFGITPAFIESMKGEFNHTIIMMMGCTGLEPNHISMAQALIKKGAEVYIGLDGLVSPSYTDHATTKFLQKLLTENKTIQNAVIETNSEVQPDPVYKSKLAWYPSEKGNVSFQHLFLTMSAGRKREFPVLADYKRKTRRCVQTLRPLY